MLPHAELLAHLGIAFGALVSASLVGAAFCRWVLGDPDPIDGWRARLGFGCLAGLGLVGLQLLGACIAGIPLGRSVAVLVLLSPLVPTAWCRWRARARARSERTGRTERERDRAPDRGTSTQDIDAAPRTPTRSGTRRLARTCLALTTIWLLLLGAATVVHGASFTDAHGLWLLKARVFFVDGGFDGTYLAGWADSHDRRGYPPLLSLMATWLFLLMGSDDTRAVKLLWMAFVLALVAVVGATLRRHASRRAAAWGALCVAFVPGGSLLAVWGTADLPLGAYVTASVAVLLRDGRRAPRGRVAGLAALLLGCAVLVKNEGGVLVVSLAAMLVCTAWIARRSHAARAATQGRATRAIGSGAQQVELAGAPDRWIGDAADETPAAVRVAVPDAVAARGSWPWRMGLALVFPIALWLGWRAWLSSRGIDSPSIMSGDASQTAPIAERARLIAGAALKQALMPSWLFVWPAGALASVALWWARRRHLAEPVPSGPARMCLAVGAAQLLAYACAYGSATGDLAFLLSTTASRIAYHVWPLVLCGVLIAWESLGPGSASESRDALANDAGIGASRGGP